MKTHTKIWIMLLLISCIYVSTYAQGTFCNPTPSPNNNYEYIQSVQIGNFINDSGKGSGYNDFTSQQIEVIRGQSYNVTRVQPEHNVLQKQFIY